MTCPFCLTTGHYTDAHLQVRCLHCFNHLDLAPGITDQALHNDLAPMVIVSVVAPNRELMHYGR